MSGLEFFYLTIAVASLAAFLGGLSVLLGTRGGRGYLTADTVPAIGAPAWLVAVALAAAFLGYTYEAAWIAAALVVLALSVPTAMDLWGLRAMGPAAALAGGACACLGALPVQMWGQWVWLDMFREMSWSVTAQPCVAAFVETPTVGSRLAMIQGIVFEAPVVEELAMTGMLYPWLKGRIGRCGACLLTALVFSLLHYHPIGIPKFFLHSLMATWLFETTRSLLPAMAMHFVGNALVTAMLWLEYPCG